MKQKNKIFKKMKKNPTMTIFLILIASILVVYAAGSQGLFQHILYSPYMTPMVEEELTYDNSLKYQNMQPDIAKTPLTSNYEDFEYPKGYGSGAPYCKIGGTYEVRVGNDADNPKIECNTPGDEGCENDVIELYIDPYYTVFGGFYCKTTKDMITYMNMPSEWQNDQLLLYCSDGSMISNDNIYEVMTTKFNVYKVCVLKNLNKEKDNTVIYGLGVGNKVLDEPENYGFSSEDEAESTVKGDTANDEEDNVIVSANGDANKLTYEFEYNAEKTLFSLANSGVTLDMPIASVFPGTESIHISRIAMFKSSGLKKIYGYEMIETIQNPSPAYIIKLEGFNMPAEECKKTLARYDFGDNIQCGYNEIGIIKSKMDENIQEGATFHLFNNIITFLG